MKGTLALTYTEKNTIIKKYLRKILNSNEITACTKQMDFAS